MLLGGIAGGVLSSIPSIAMAQELPEITVSAEWDVALDALGYDYVDTSPSDQFFSELNAYLREAYETVDFWIKVFREWVDAPVGELVQAFQTYAAANRLQYQTGVGAFAAYQSADYAVKTGQAIISRVIQANVPTAPMTGFYFFAFGNGEPVTVPIETMGLNITLDEVGANGSTTNAVPLIDFINANSAPGSYYYNSNAFGYPTYPDNWFTGKTIGNFSMITEGTLTRNPNGSWNFNGQASAAIPDRYDANPSNYRDDTNELWTTLLRKIGGTPYDVNIPGALPLNFSGQ